MNLTTCLRQRAPALCCLRTRGMSSIRKKSPTPLREAGSQAPTKDSEVLPHTTLPPAKMRALVALYHQAGDWITEENLLYRIDKAFIPDLESGTMMISTGSGRHRNVSYNEIEQTKKTILSAPKMSKWDTTAGAPLQERTESNAGSWSNSRAVRERRVIEALYGVVVSPDGQTLLPGIEVVEESAKLLKEHKQKDDEAESQRAKEDLTFESGTTFASEKHSKSGEAEPGL